MESRKRNIDLLLGIAFIISASIVAYARYLHPATFSVLVFPALAAAACMFVTMYYIRTRI